MSTFYYARHQGDTSKIIKSHMQPFGFGSVFYCDIAQMAYILSNFMIGF